MQGVMTRHYTNPRLPYLGGLRGRGGKGREEKG